MDKKEFVFPGIVLGIVIIIAAGLLLTHPSNPTLLPETDTSASSTVSAGSATSSAPSHASGSTGSAVAYYPYGQVELSIGHAAGFKDGLSMRPLAIVEDSRCPAGVTCIQAGTVRVSLKVNAGGKESIQTIGLGKSIAVGGDTILLTKVAPERQKDAELSPSDYALAFSVTRGAAVAAGPCYVGGCSNEICGDSQNIISNCLYSPSFACYKTAACERQTDGKCGWTQTKELAACIDSTK